MDLTHRIRIGFAAAIALTAAASIVLAEGTVAGGPADPLLPDLKTLKAPSYDPLRMAHNSAGKRTLRIANRIGNQGTGPLELYPEPATDSNDIDCTVGEYPDGNDRDANQRIWEDTNGNGQWDGPAAAQPDQISEEPKVGCFEYHPAHGHWHFQDFSVYALLDLETGDLVAGPSRKIGFCILDGDRFQRHGEFLPGSPVFREYPGGDGGCGGAADPDPPFPPGTMGLSVGWADTYGSSLPGQQLDVSGVPTGRYCMSATANPEHAVDDPSQIVESNPDNNSRRRVIRLNTTKFTVKTTDEACPPVGP